MIKKTTKTRDISKFSNNSLSSAEDTYMMEYDNDTDDQSDHINDTAIVAFPSSSSSTVTATTISRHGPQSSLPYDGFDDSIKSLPSFMWSEPDANTFMVRGKHYKTNHKKYKACRSVFRLLTVDLVEVDVPMTNGISEHPEERMQWTPTQNHTNTKAAPPYTVIINISIPGPPHYHLVMYYAVDDISTIDGSNGTPFGKLAQKFFFDEDNTFRDRTFKLVPRVVEGNFCVRRAVGSNTPVLMGTKLQQRYIRRKNYFELVMDVGSSTVAANVVWLSMGYAKSLVVDIAFLLEGNDESTLPERVMGCCRLSNVDVETGARYVSTV